MASREVLYIFLTAILLTILSSLIEARFEKPHWSLNNIQFKPKLRHISRTSKSLPVPVNPLQCFSSTSALAGQKQEKPLKRFMKLKKHSKHHHHQARSVQSFGERIQQVPENLVPNENILIPADFSENQLRMREEQPLLIPEGIPPEEQGRFVQDFLNQKKRARQLSNHLLASFGTQVAPGSKKKK